MKKRYYVLLFIVAVLFVILNSLGTIFYGFNGNIDSCIFNTIGKYWSEGYLPYISLYDHKGPLIFFINMLSWKFFNCERGILLFQVISVFSSLVFLMKIAMLKLGNIKKSIAFTVLTLGYLVITYFGGNMTEEYCLPFLIATMYFNLKYLKNYTENKIVKHSMKHAFFYGISFSVCFLTRLTNSISILIGIIVITFILIKKKEYKEIIKNALCFIGGFLMLTIPFVVYFTYNNAFYEFLDATLLFNIKYASKSASWLLKENLLTQIVKFLIYFFPSYCMIPIGYSKIKKGHKEVGIYYILLGIFEVLLFASNRMFRHYGTIILPNFLIILLEIEALKLKSIIKKTIYATVIFVSLFCCVVFAKNQLKKTFRTDLYDNVILSLNSEDKNSFIMWNGNVEIYEYYNIKPYYKYFVTQDWHASFSDEISKDMYNTFYSGDVKYILFVGDIQNSLIRDVINERYEIVKSVENLNLYRIKYDE